MQNEPWQRDQDDPTLSHSNAFVFYEVANSYEFVRPHSYDLVRFL